MEQTQEAICTSDSYAELLKYEPKLITNFVPSNGVEQKTAFITGEVENPNHTYGKLSELNFADIDTKITELRDKLLTSTDLVSKHVPSYEQFIDDYKKKTRFLELAHAYKQLEDGEEKNQVRDEYMQLNIELYGEPSPETYRSLLAEKIDDIQSVNMTGRAAHIREELIASMSAELGTGVEERFRPSAETIEWMHGASLDLYGNMLMHIPGEQETFSTEEMKGVFEEILANEFGESASGWRVDIEPAQSINVKTTEKRIVIPVDRGDVTKQQLRGLVVHEIGIHVLRSLMGESSDLESLKIGLSGYYDAEEGLGMVMEQALGGEFAESGVDHYITAGLAHVDHMDFRKTFEVKWRLSILDKLKDDEEITDEAVSKAQDKAYSSTMRIFRGTDDLPWFKDLAYYNGSVDMWRHLEDIRGDDLMFTFVLLGKANPADISHQRMMLETKTI